MTTDTATAIKNEIDLVNDTIVSIPNLADQFGISRAAAWRKILKGEWPSVKIGNSRRTSLEACARRIQERQGS